MGGRKASMAAPWLILGAVGIVLLVAVPQFSLEGAATPRATLLVATAAWFVYGLRLRGRQWRIDDVPTSECANVAVGFAEVSGRARLDPPLAARGSATPCAYYRWELQEYRRSGKNSRWVTVEKESRAPRFRVLDTTGEVHVNPDHAEFVGLDAHHLRVRGRGRKWRQVEWRMDIDEPVYVIGPTRVAPASAAVEFGTDDADDEFIISDESERKVRGRVAASAWCCTALAALGAGSAFVVRADPGVDSSGDATVDFGLDGEWSRLRWFAIAGLAVLGALLATSWVVRAYNRLVRVRGQAERAWSLIDVELQRRHDLLAALVAVVRAAGVHETVALTQWATTRSRLPSGSQVAAADGAEADLRGQAAGLVALAEALPTLKADSQYRALADAITTSEDRVAAARRFYNDAVTVLRDRRGVLPYSLVAWRVPCPSFDLFTGERAVPRVDSHQ